ncbi:putative peptidoglycan lipid II flippase [Microlunatus sagamiharensis]|uniref:Putative peptidoglycan lipid II flippase n=1 Tax=Microlunatus sagamiharensis TaxID=546874 RepID=A0A1H2LWV0_9ACTN|nr:lipid II flippase MurJ [Microlunatus sagamiharensis]SDU85344.1 putative peptidoglycan lipid II flippase [Microlunatus sagamiharensis]
MRLRGSVLLGVGGLTLAARVVGFGRSLVFSKTVGDTCLGDVYNAANALPNVLFEVAAGGVLAGVVVPVVARHVGAGRRDEAHRTTSALLSWTLLVLSVVAVAALLGAGIYARAYAKADCAGSVGVLTTLVVVFVPQVWFYGVAVVTAGVLQAHGRFLAAATAPLLSSVVVIAAYVLFAGLAAPGASADLGLLSGRALLVLGLGTTAGVVALALCTALPLARLGLRVRPTLHFAPGDARVVAAIGAAGLAGLVLQQVSVLVINLAAQRDPDPGALTRFTWANALYLLPYAVLAAPVLQLTFPRLAAAAEQGGAEVAGVLRRTAPALVVLGWLGAALLVATAVPVARVFVLGPGSGRTAALAGPVAALAPAVLAFALMGLATRTLLAQHRALAAGTTTAVAWGVVTAGALVSAAAVPTGVLVVALATSVSLGLAVGAVVGWVAVHRSRPGDAPGAGLPAALLAGVVAAVPAVLAGGALARLGDGAGLVVAAGLALAAALVTAVVFVGVLALVRPSLLRATWALRHVGSPEEAVGARG